MKKKTNLQKNKSKARIIEMLIDSREDLRKKLAELELEIKEIDSIIKCILKDCYKKERL